MIEQSLSGEGTWSEDLPLITQRNGYEETAYFTVSFNPVRDENGEVAGLLCASAETTQKVHAEAALQHSEKTTGVAEARLRSLFQQAPGFMAMASGPNHVFEMANAAYRRLVGSRELVGKTVREALPEVAKQGFIDLLDKVYATGRPYIGRGVPIMVASEPDAAPTQRYIDFIYQPMTSSDGSVTGIFCEGQPPDY